MAMIVVNFFHSEWASARGINGDIAHKAKTELDANLRLFYTDDTATNYFICRIDFEKYFIKAIENFFLYLHSLI